jgi:hypothetical protein
MLSAASINDPFEGSGILSYGGAGGGSYGAFGDRGYPDFTTEFIVGRRGYGRYDLDPIFDVEKYADSFEHTGEFQDESLLQGATGAITQKPTAAANSAAAVAGDDEWNLINDPLFWAALIVVGVIALT